VALKTAYRNALKVLTLSGRRNHYRFGFYFDSVLSHHLDSFPRFFCSVCQSMRPSMAELRRRFPCMLAVVLLMNLMFAFPFAAANKLHFKFIGNQAFLITDGNTTLLTDFPYTSGAFGYMTYDFTAPHVDDIFPNPNG
jgi:hypothetical protein